MFESVCRKVGQLQLPAFTGTRIMMMPVIIGDLSSIPETLNEWRDSLKALFDLSPQYAGQVGYLTIDEKQVVPATTHRRAGRHVDGVYRGVAGPWGGGGWGAAGTGMLTVASHVGCRAWNGQFEGFPGYEGECDHLADQCCPENEVVFGAGEVYWVDGLCVHESIPQAQAVDRQFVRLSMPSTAPWFEGYTENPMGVKPTGPILPRREFMDA